MIVLFGAVQIEMATAAAGTFYEGEINDSYWQANITYDDYDNHGIIINPSDVDWWRVTFAKCGNANFWLGDIPAGCNYDLYLYASDGTTELASSKHTGNSSELFSYPVLSGVQYYIKIVSAGGYSNSYYLFRTKNYPEVILDRTYSVYSQVSPYSSYMLNKMNCYGYAMHVYCKDVSGNNYYLQQPGEFVHDDQTFSALNTERNYYLDNKTATEILDYIQGKMYADIQSFGGGEWSIVETSATASVPAGCRKIALTVGCGYDYHFYVRHSNGYWSHKPGSWPITNLSPVSGVSITDSNILSVVNEGGYGDGVRFYLIGKSFVVDYAHENGHATNQLYTQTAFKDQAGDIIYKSAQNGAAIYKSCRFDYAGDIDFYEIVPNTTKNYYIKTYLNSSTYDTDIILYDHTGTQIDCSVGTGNAEVYHYLVAGTKYYVKIFDVNNNVVDYVLIVNG